MAKYNPLNFETLQRLKVELADKEFKASETAKKQAIQANKNTKFTMRPTYEGTIPPEQSLTRYVPGKGVVPIDGTQATNTLKETAGAKNFYTSQGDSMAEFGKNVPGSRTQLPTIYDPLVQGIQGKAPSMLSRMKNIGTKALPYALKGLNIVGNVGMALSPTDTVSQEQEMVDLAINKKNMRNDSTGFETTVAGNLSKDLLSPQEQFNMPMLTDAAQAITGTNPMDFNKPNQAVQALNNMPVIQNTEVQSPIIKADTSNSDTAHNDFMQRYLEQAANNSVGMQGMNAANSATAYSNMLEAGIARGANSRSKGSYHPTYQKAVAYTPQAMNFGSNQQQASNPYLGMFEPNSGTQFMTPRKDKQMPVGMNASSITQNGKSIWDAKGKLITNKELTSQMQAWGDKPYQAPDTVATSIRDAWGNKNYQGLYNSMGGF